MGITVGSEPHFERATSGAGALACERAIDATSEPPGTATFFDDPRSRSIRRRDAPRSWLEPCCLSVEPVAEAWP